MSVQDDKILAEKDHKIDLGLEWHSTELERSQTIGLALIGAPALEAPTTQREQRKPTSTSQIQGRLLKRRSTMVIDH